MGTVAQISEIQSSRSKFEQAKLNVCEAKGILSALSNDDNFTDLDVNSIAACLSAVMGKLEDINSILSK